MVNKYFKYMIPDYGNSFKKKKLLSPGNYSSKCLNDYLNITELINNRIF